MVSVIKREANICSNSQTLHQRTGCTLITERRGDEELVADSAERHFRDVLCQIVSFDNEFCVREA